jgi:hypothetical protein
MSGPGLDGQITRYRAHATPAPINQICSASSLSGTNPMAAPNGGSGADDPRPWRRRLETSVTVCE